MNGKKKFLVIRLSSFGDIVLSFPFLREIKTKFDCEITYLTKENNSEIVSLNADVDELILLNKTNLKEIAGSLSSQKFDAVFDLQNNLRSSGITKKIKSKVYRFDKENLKKFLFVRLKLNLYDDIKPVYARYIELLSRYGVETYYTFKTANYKLSFEHGEKDYIVIAPSARHFTKIYPKEKFAEAVNQKLNDVKVYLVGSKSNIDMQICSYIEKSCPNTINLCGKTNISGLLSLLHGCSYVISNDSAILHLSESLGKKVIAIFGSTVKEFGFAPQLGDSVMLENKGLYCRPCTHIGRAKCPEGHFRCMREIELKDALN